MYILVESIFINFILFVICEEFYEVLNVLMIDRYICVKFKMYNNSFLKIYF